MHIVNTNKMNLRTDLTIDTKIPSNKILETSGISLYNSRKKDNNYSTITFIDPTDTNQETIIETILINELKRYIKNYNNGPLKYQINLLLIRCL